MRYKLFIINKEISNVEFGEVNWLGFYKSEFYIKIILAAINLL